MNIVPEDIVKYLKGLKEENDSLILEMEVLAKERKIPILERLSAEFIEVLVQMIRPEKVLEVGTAIAYTSIRIARHLNGEGKIDTLEMSKDNIPLAKQFIKKSGLEEKINLIEGNALQIIPELSDSYDLIFLDADKEDYPAYYELLLPKLKTGGVLLIDNLLWKGQVIFDEVSPDYKASTGKVKEINKTILNDTRVIATIATIGDGLGICVKL